MHYYLVTLVLFVVCADACPGASQVFASKAQPAIAALRSMVDRLERDLRALLAYFGESSTGEPKPEELFNTVVSFAGALIVSRDAVWPPATILRTGAD